MRNPRSLFEETLWWDWKRSIAGWEAYRWGSTWDWPECSWEPAKERAWPEGSDPGECYKMREGWRQGGPCRMVHRVLVHVKDLRCYFRFKEKWLKGFEQRNKGEHRLERGVSADEKFLSWSKWAHVTVINIEVNRPKIQFRVKSVGWIGHGQSPRTDTVSLIPGKVSFPEEAGLGGKSVVWLEVWQPGVGWVLFYLQLVCKSIPIELRSCASPTRMRLLLTWGMGVNRRVLTQRVPGGAGRGTSGECADKVGAAARWPAPRQEEGRWGLRNTSL